MQALDRPSSPRARRKVPAGGASWTSCYTSRRLAQGLADNIPRSSLPRLIELRKGDPREARAPIGGGRI